LGFCVGLRPNEWLNVRAGEIEDRDRIYDYLGKTDGGISSHQLCEKFFENHLTGNPDRHVRRLLIGDPRFNEPSPGQWGLAKFSSGNETLDQVRYCVFDLETTGGIPPLHKVIEIGAVILEDGKIVEEFQCLVQPGRPIPDYVRRLTGIQHSDLKAGCQIEKALEGFERFSAGSVLVAHNAAFDVNFLQFEMQRVFSKSLSATDNICSLKLSKYLVKDSPAHKLEVLSQYFGVEVKDRHRALSDARMTAGVFQKLLGILSEKTGLKTIRDVRKFSVRARSSYFPSCMVSPEQLDALTDGCGAVYFLSETGKRLHCRPSQSVQKDLKSIFYERVRRSGFLKRLLKRSKSFLVIPQISYLNALLAANKFQAQRGRDRDLCVDKRPAYYLKMTHLKSQEILITSRKLRDDGIYLGPFDTQQEAASQLKKGFSKKNIPYQRFPPKSGVEEVYSFQNGDLYRYFQTRQFHNNKTANLIVSVANGEGRIQLMFLREGYLVKRRNMDFKQMEEHAIENVFREILKSYYVERPLNDILGKPTTIKGTEYDIIMRWLNGMAPKETNCKLRFLGNEELKDIQLDLVRSLAKELIWEKVEEE
jgi:DNA polymerase III epsilon subunit family exonuclease